MDMLVYALSLFSFLVLIIYFVVKWRLELAKNRGLVEQLEFAQLSLNASLGGYYCYQSESEKEYFSPNLVSMLSLPKAINTFEEFITSFDADCHMLTQGIEDLKYSRQAQFSINIRGLVSGQERHYSCAGYRVDDSKGEIVAVIVWFFDMTEYVQRLLRMTSENYTVKQQMRNYLNILNLLPFPVWQRNTDSFDVSYYNLMYSRFIDDGGLHDNDADVPQLYDGLKNASKTAISEGRQFLDKRHLVFEGERRYFSVSERVSDDKQSILGVAYDITELEDAQEELSRHVSAHADLLESSSSAMAIYGRDTKLKFYNNAFMRLGDFDEAWLNANPTYVQVIEYLREKRKLPEQADFSSFRRQQMQLFENLMETHEEFFHLPDGQTLRVIVIPHALGGLLFAYEDVTDRLAMERSYNTLIEVQKVTLDNVNEGLAVYGSDNRLKFYNPQYAALWPEELPFLDKNPTPSELIDASKEIFVFEGTWNKYKQSILDFINKREHATRTFERADGKIIEQTLTPLPDGDILLSYRDITAASILQRSLEERNEALEEADKLKTEFLANVSYEFRTPLTSIKGFAELLLDLAEKGTNIEHIDYIKNIFESSIQLMSVIDDVLDLASIEAGYLTLDISSFEVQPTIAFVQKILKERAKRNGVKIKLSCTKTVGSIVADERRIQQVLFNLLSNAIKFSPENETITIGAKTRNKDHVVLWVQDKGEGIAKREQSKVFDRFYSTPSAQSLGKSGTGLGLAVVKHIVELHGGFVELESQKGEGTKISCVLPRAAELTQE